MQCKPFGEGLPLTFPEAALIHRWVFRARGRMSLRAVNFALEHDANWACGRDKGKHVRDAIFVSTCRTGARGKGEAYSFGNTYQTLRYTWQSLWLAWVPSTNTIGVTE